MSIEVECPYCEEYVKISPDDHYEGREEYECSKCLKNFEVLAEVEVNYNSCGKADCINGGEHKWKQICGAPTIHFKGKYRCEDCSAENTVKEEVATQEEWDTYFNQGDKI